MKRFKVIGLCFVAAFAFSALAATGAQAKKSEHGELYVTSSGGEAHLGTEKGSIHSTTNNGTGHITTATGGTATSSFSGVEIEGTGLKCNSAGKTGGVVETNLLAEETGWISKANNEAGVDFKPASGTYLAEFECEGGLAVKVKDSVIGHVTPLNVDSAASKLDLIPNATGKANSPEAFEGGSKDILETEFNSAPGSEFESLQQQENVQVKNHGTVTGGACKLKKGVEKCKPGQAELNTLANSAQPEFGRCVKQKGGKFGEANCATLAAEKGKFEFVPIPG